MAQTDPAVMQAIAELQSAMDLRLGAVYSAVSAVSASQAQLNDLVSEVINSQASAASDQNILVASLNQIVSAQSTNQAACIALLTQIQNEVALTNPLLDRIIAATLGAASPLSVISVLQSSVDNLADQVAAILADVGRILTFSTPGLEADLPNATHTLQPPPPKG